MTWNSVITFKSPRTWVTYFWKQCSSLPWIRTSSHLLWGKLATAEPCHPACYWPVCNVGSVNHILRSGGGGSELPCKFGCWNPRPKIQCHSPLAINSPAKYHTIHKIILTISYNVRETMSTHLVVEEQLRQHEQKAKCIDTCKKEICNLTTKITLT